MHCQAHTGGNKALTEVWRLIVSCRSFVRHHQVTGAASDGGLRAALGCPAEAETVCRSTRQAGGTLAAWCSLSSCWRSSPGLPLACCRARPATRQAPEGRHAGLRDAWPGSVKALSPAAGARNPQTLQPQTPNPEPLVPDKAPAGPRGLSAGRLKSGAALSPCPHTSIRACGSNAASLLKPNPSWSHNDFNGTGRGVSDTHLGAGGGDIWPKESCCALCCAAQG